MLWRRKNSFERLASAMFLIIAFLIVAPAQPPRNKSINRETPAQMLEAATQAVQNADFDKAGNLLKKIISADPKNVTAHTLAGIVADHSNNLDEAAKHFAFAAKISPNSAETRNNYGAILLRLKRPSEAAKEFFASLATNPNQPSALVNLSQIKFAENTTQSLREAKNLLTKANQIAPDAEILRALVLVNLRLNDAAAAAADYQSYAALENGSNTTAAQIELGAALAENNLTKEAIREFQSVLKREPSNVDALTALTRGFLTQKDIKAAGRTLESAVARGLDDARIYAALADVYEAGGYVENAIPAMRLAIEKDPKNEFYRVRYGLFLNDTSAPQAAIIRLNEAVKDIPHSAKIWLALGIAQQADGKSADAQISFEKALQLEPKSIPALAYLATVFTEKAQYNDAAALLERALGVEEKNALLHYLLADTLLKISDSKPAQIERHLKRAVEIDDRLASAHLALGRLYARGERWQQAANEFQQAVKFAPELAEAQYQLGRALVRLKRMEESRAAFDKFKKLNETQTAQKDVTRKELVRRLANTRF